MPYVPEFRRQMVNLEGPANEGELCYLIYRECLEYIDGARAFNKFAQVLGAIEAAKLELYRSHIGPYEETKKEANGDVLPAA